MKYCYSGSTVFLSGLLLLMNACSEPTESTIESTVPVTDTVAVEETGDKVFYQVPGPNEMFAFIRESSNVNKVTSLLNDPENYNRYNDLYSKSLNFGIYSTDLLYCSTFDLGPEVMKYFAVVKKMSDDLGISSAIKESDMQRIEKSIGTNDSLTAVANEIYYNTYQTLEENDMGNILAQMVAGGWIESLYLVTSMNKDYDMTMPVYQRVADQKLTLENLISYLEKYKDDQGIQTTLDHLQSIYEVYEGFETTSEGATQVDHRNGKMVLSGGSTINMTAEQYAKLSSRFAEIRNTLTGTNL